MSSIINICWLRRDLRLEDNVALCESLKKGPTLVVFIFDKCILSELTDREDQRVSFIYDSLREIENELQKHQSSLFIAYGDPVEEIPRIVKKFDALSVYYNRDYEPYAKKRDKEVERELKKINVNFYDFKDSVVFEKDEVLTKTNNPFKVFTPYKNRWIELFESQNKEYEYYSCDLERLLPWDNPQSILKYDWYQKIGFKKKDPILPGGRSHALKRINKFEERIYEYHENRNFPSIEGTSLLSVYIRHGNISIREVIKLAKSQRSEGHKSFLNEIIWRDFYQMIFDVHPHVTHKSFKPEYDQIKFLGTDDDFLSWCKGETGFPLIDAAMRCLNATGLMHNRLRMLTASFLCKILLVDWRKGEKYFAQKLLDYDLAANNGGWQWSASTGCDAQPYFRIFNPYTQSIKFDSDGDFIRKWVPEISHLRGKEIHHPNSLTAPKYISPIANYEVNRKKCMMMYESIKNK